MSKLSKIGAAILCISFALPLLAVDPPKKPPKHGRGKMIPARHNAGRPMHA